jgi:heme/copper-type cytochrome/quinol oxidase subunit 2
MRTIFIIALVVSVVLVIAFWDARRKERKNRDDWRRGL